MLSTVLLYFAYYIMVLDSLPNNFHCKLHILAKNFQKLRGLSAKLISLVAFDNFYLKIFNSRDVNY